MLRPHRLTPPPPAAGAFLRARLLAVVAQRWQRRLVVVEAGAGLGKSTLLAQAYAENLLDPAGIDAWVTCEPADSSSSTLLSGLLAALGRPEDATTIPSVESVCDAVWSAAPADVCLPRRRHRSPRR